MVAQVPVLRLELPPDYMFRNRLEQASVVARFLEALRAQLAALDLTPLFAFGFDFARVADLTAGCLMAIEQRLERRKVLRLNCAMSPAGRKSRPCG